MVKILDKIFLGVLFLLCVAFFFQLDELPQMPFQPLGAGGFAQGILVLLVLGILWVLLEDKKKTKSDSSTNSQEQKSLIASNVVIWIVITFIMMILYCALFKILGYFTTGFIVLVIYMHSLFYAQEKMLRIVDSIKLIFIGAVTIGVLYIVFGLLFELYLPEGIFI